MSGDARDSYYLSMRDQRQMFSFLKAIPLEFYAANIAKYIIIHKYVSYYQQIAEHISFINIRTRLLLNVSSISYSHDEGAPIYKR
jgi:hypothetical protein